ncbi:MAG: veratrol--corrinoid protein metyltransferase [Oscillospiraceae bacterium]|jgi:hypothetical protein|nr:veratrol--corrinoid protein metyltransferase [Oscillospiraceae bacterium]
MLTEKENLLRALRGEVPAWVPHYTYGTDPEAAHPPALQFVMPPMFTGSMVPGGGTDVWGVKYVPSDEAAGASLPEPNNFILRDITKWRDVIKAPDYSNVDWEATMTKAIAESGIDRSQTALQYGLLVGYFQLLMSFMGFTEGLCAIQEEPEEVADLLNYLADFYVGVLEKTIDIVKPEILNMGDDTAAWGTPFISKKQFDEIFVPLYRRHTRFAVERGISVDHHNCGKCEGFLDSMVDIGVNMWDPAQTCNDLVGVKRKFGNRLVIAGGFDARGRLLEPGCTDEEIRAAVKNVIDTLAPGGGYAFAGAYLGATGDAEIKRRNKVVNAAVSEYGRKFYA